MAWRGGKYLNTRRRSYAVLNLQVAHYWLSLQFRNRKEAANGQH